MNLMTSEAALRLLPAAEPANTSADVLFFGVGDSALGKVLLAAAPRASARSCSATTPANWKRTSRVVFPKPLSSRTRP
jgi:hypothetical protein